MSKESVMKYRQQLMAALAMKFGNKILDVGFADSPNEYIKGTVVGVDNVYVNTPINYSRTEILPIDIGKEDFQKVFGAELGTYDSVIAGEVVEHVQNILRMLKNCKDLLRMGGGLILSTPNPYFFFDVIVNMLNIKHDGVPLDHLVFISEKEMSRLAYRAGFKIVKKYNVSFAIPLLRWEFVVKRVPRMFSNRIVYEMIKESD